MNLKDSCEKQPLLSHNREKTNDSKSRNKYMIYFIILAAALAAAFIVYPLKSDHPTMKNVSLLTNALAACSSNGILLSDKSCLCDLGYAGQFCESLQTPAVPKEKTAALFVDAFGDLNSQSSLSLAYETLAAQLSEQGYFVTVVYTGMYLPAFNSIASRYTKFSLVYLPESGAEFGEKHLESRSFDAFKFLQTHDFSLVYFSSSSGIGYYSISSHHQGLLARNSKFIVGIDNLPLHTQMKIDNEVDGFIVTDSVALKEKFMIEMSTSLSDTVVFFRKNAIRTLLDDGFNFKEDQKKFSLLPMPHSNFIRHDQGTYKAKELVFIGELSQAGGLKVFCDVVDSILESGTITGLKLTFIGSLKSINGLDAKEYIQLRSSKWESYKVEWKILLDSSMKTAFDYVNAENTGRLAVMPSVSDFSSVMKNNFDFYGVAYVESDFYQKIKNSIINGVPSAKKVNPSDDDKFALFLSGLISEPSIEKSIENDKPLVSVILVHHNRPELLKQAISSLEKQTYTNFEVVLVDDGSTDPAAIAYIDELSWKWWEEKGWKVIREPNRYLGASRNTGVKHANGKFVLFMDDDDYAKPHQIETFVKVAMATKSPVMTSGHDIFNGRSPPTGQSSLRYTPIGADVLSGMLENVFGDSAMFVEKEYFVESGGFTEEFGVGFEDYEYLAKVALRGDKMEAIAEPLHWYRIHQGTMSESTQLKANQLRMLRSYVDHNYLSDASVKKLLLFVQKRFFEENGSAPFKRGLGFLNSDLDVLLNLASNSTEALGLFKLDLVPPSSSWKALTNFLNPSVISRSKDSRILVVGNALDEATTIFELEEFGELNFTKYRRVEGKDYFQISLPSKIIFSSLTKEFELLVKRKVASLAKRSTAAHGPAPVVKEEPKVEESGPAEPELVYSLPITLYNPDISKVVLVEYSERGYINNLMTVKFHATNLPRGESITPKCMYKITMLNDFFYRLADPLQYDTNAGVVVCGLALPYSATVEVKVALTPMVFFPQTADYKDATPEPFLFGLEQVVPIPMIKVYGPAPNMLAAEFNVPTYTINVNFSHPFDLVKQGDDGKYINLGLSTACSNIFRATPFNRTGTAKLSDDPSDCTATKSGAKALVLSFSKSFLRENSRYVIRPGDSLIQIPNTIRYFSALHSDLSHSILLVQGPSLLTFKTTPVVSGEVESSIGLCNNLAIGLASMIGKAALPLEELSVELVAPGSSIKKRSTAPAHGEAPAAEKPAAGNPGTAEVDEPFSLEEIIAKLNEQAHEIVENNAKPELFISARNLGNLTNGVYQIVMKAKDFLGGSNQATLSFTRTSEVKPVLNIFGPTDIRSNMAISIDAKVDSVSSSNAACSVSGNYAFSWEVYGKFTGTKPASTVSSLIIPQFALLPKETYAIKAIATNGAKSTFKWFNFTTPIDVVEVSAGVSRTVGKSQPLVLNAGIVDLAYRPGSFNQFTCVWTCISSTTVCMSVKTQSPIVLNTCKLDLSGSLSPGEYTFGVTVNNPVTGASGISRTIKITVQEASLPLFTVSQSRLSPSAEERDFAITVQVANTSVTSLKNVVYSWESVTTCASGETGVPIDFNSASNFVAFPVANVVKFAPSVLQAGATYCLKFRITDTVAQVSTGFSEIQFKVKEKPNGGSCAPSSFSVEEFSTLSVTCSGWKTDTSSYPLYYTLSLLKTGEKTYRVASLNSKESTVSLKLASGSYKVRVIVTDSSKSVSDFKPEFDITVTRSGAVEAAVTSAKALLTDGKAELLKSGGVQEFIGAMNAIAGIGFSNIQTSDTGSIDLQKSFIENIDFLTDSGLVTLDDEGTALLASNLKAAFGDSCSIPDGNSVGASNALFNLMGKARTSNKESGTSLTANSLDSLAGSFDALLCTTAAGSSNADTVADKMNGFVLNIAQSALENAVCGETAYSNTGDSFSLSAGVGSLDATSFGDFDFGSNFDSSSFAPSGCPPFIVGQKKNNLFQRKNAATSFKSDIKQMSFLDENLDPSHPSSVDVYFDITVAKGTTPACSWIKYPDSTEKVSQSTVSSAGCAVSSSVTVNDSMIVTCRCSHLTDFFISGGAISLNPAPPAPTNTPGPSTSNDATGLGAGAIAGIVIGVVLLIGIAVGAVILKSRRRSSPYRPAAATKVERGEAQASPIDATSELKEEPEADDDEIPSYDEKTAQPVSDKKNIEEISEKKEAREARKEKKGKHDKKGKQKGKSPKRK